MFRVPLQARGELQQPDAKRHTSEAREATDGGTEEMALLMAALNPIKETSDERPKSPRRFITKK